MPILDVKLSRIQQLLRKDITINELEEILFRFGMEIDSFKSIDKNDYMLKIEITPDRPDMLSLWGFVRALRKYIKLENKFDEYNAKDSDFKIYVDTSVSPIRPYIAATVVKNLKMTENDLEDLIYAQEKLHDTFCRGRKKASIGLYPFQKISWPLRYLAENPNKIRFKPLGFEKEMNGIEILKEHPTGQKYGHLISSFEKYPLFIDASEHVLSLPPIINSEDYGKISPDNKDILIEVTGTHKPSVQLIINIMSTIIADMGGELYKVKIVYPDHEEESPYLQPKKRTLDTEYVWKILGIEIPPHEIKSLLMKMGLHGQILNQKKIEVLVPPYRADIWHPIDIVDDIARAYGFDNFDPELTPVFTTGNLLEKTKFIDHIREIMIGLGFTEVFTFALTNREDQFTKMRLPVDPQTVQILAAKEAKINMVRKWLLPEILKTLSFNKDKRYPIKLFEISDVVVLSMESDTGAINQTHLAAVSAHKEADFTEIKSIVEYLIYTLGISKYELRRVNHSSFIEGRVAELIVNNRSIGIFGELHPETILNWGLAVPISAMELSLDSLFDWKWAPVEIA